MSDSLSFGDWLRQQRDARGLTRDELAEYLDFSKALLRKLEAGERRPSGQIAELLAAYFGIPADERAAFVAYARSGQAAGDTSTAGPDDGTRHTPWRSVYRHQTNLPALLAPLIGRERESTTVQALLRQPKTRLLTLSGTPGIGKTRLSLQVATGLVDYFAQGVYFVDLAPLSDPALVLPTVARTLGLQEAGERPIERILLDYVSGRRLLLLLDNFEQVLDAAPAVVQLLEASPWLKVLVTSREALHVRGEHRFPLAPLGLPDAQQLPALAGLASYPAVALFVERAQEVDPTFALTAENAADVAAVCIGLAGVPLAIELAAARTRHLAPAVLRQALSSQLKLLTDGARDQPARHQSIRHAIAWSYDLLEEREQRLFRALGVFVGGFTVAGLEGLWAGQPDAPPDAFGTLCSLIDKHLVQQVRPAAGPGSGRFGLLEAVREYALERLVQQGESAAMQRRHATYYLALAEQAELQLWGPQQARWLDHLESEHDNLRAVLGWALTHDPPTALRSTTAIWRFWHVRGYWSEGREHLAAALAGLARPVSSTAQHARADALNGASVLAQEQGDLPAARRLLEQCMTLARECGARQTVARALRGLGNMAGAQGDWAAARDLHTQSLALSRAEGYEFDIGLGLFSLGNVALAEANYAYAGALYAAALSQLRDLGDQRNMAVVLSNLGWLAGHQGDYAAARALLEQSLTLFCELGDRGFIAHLLQLQGDVAMWQGDYPAASSLSEQSLSLSQELGNSLGVLNALLNLGNVAAAERDQASADGYFRQALLLAQELEMPLATAECLAGLGGAAVGQGRPAEVQRGVLLLGVVAAPLRAQWEALEPWSRRQYEQWLLDARAALDGAAFSAAFSAGEAMPFGKAVALALGA